MNSFGAVVALGFLGLYLVFYGGYISNTPIKALAFQHTEFYLGHIKPTRSHFIILKKS